jgi:hydroxyacylglutathione hydrolase
MPTLSLTLNNSLNNRNYLIYCTQTRECLVIDPLNVDLIIQTANENNLIITQIVNTHEHWDHTAGNEALKKATRAKIYAHHQAKNLIPGFDQGLKANDQIHIGTSITLKVLETPGHTLHSICLFNEHDPAIYTGDTLFHCGCGNCHHGGDPEILFDTFENQLQSLPDPTQIYPGHDYLQNNLAFVQSLENKFNQDLAMGTLKEEKRVNPFFRLEDPDLIAALRDKIPLKTNPSRKEVFLALRSLRNAW